MNNFIPSKRQLKEFAWATFVCCFLWGVLGLIYMCTLKQGVPQ